MGRLYGERQADCRLFVDGSSVSQKVLFLVKIKHKSYGEKEAPTER